jgi:hypothetical protein
MQALAPRPSARPRGRVRRKKLAVSTGQYLHTTRAAGTIVTAVLYSSAHHNHLDNDIPLSTGAHSDDLAMMQALTDPYPTQVATPVVALGTELEQLRFVIADIKKALNDCVAPDQ